MTEQSANNTPAGAAPGLTAPAPCQHTWQDVWMLIVVLAALSLVFLGGMVILLAAKPGGPAGWQATDIVAVLSPAIAAVGTVAAGVFGYSLGARGTAAAQDTAVRATHTAAVAQQDKAAMVQAVMPAGNTVERIVSQARAKDENAPTYTISNDDIKTLAAAGNAIRALQHS